MGLQSFGVVAAEVDTCLVARHNAMATSLSDFVAADAGRDGPPEAHSDAGSVTGQSVASGTTALTAVSWSTHRSQASTVQAGPVIEAEPKHKIVKASQPSDSSSNFAKPVAISDKHVSCQTFYFATRCNAVVHVDFYSSERCDGAKVRVKEVHDAEILSEAEDFADFITPVFHVTLNCGPRDSMPDGQSVDLIVEVDVEGGVNTNALAFVKRSSASADDVWGGVIGGEFETLPSPTGLRMRGRITTSSFSFWGVACCHAKVAMHHSPSKWNPRICYETRESLAARLRKSGQREKAQVLARGRAGMLTRSREDHVRLLLQSCL